MDYHKVSSPTLSKKLTNGYSFSGKSIYDGVFGGAAKVGSLVEDDDYREIFGVSSSCSIPILDVPELKEKKVSVDVSSSKLDYSNIFGGFGEFDFAVSHEELFAKPNKRESFIENEEARPPAETGSHTSNFSVQNQVLSHEASNQSLDGVKQLKMPYHKTDQGRNIGVNGMTHAAQFHSLPGSACLMDEVVPPQMNEGNKPISSVSNETYHNGNFSGEIMEGKLLWKAVSAHPPGGARKQASRDSVKSNNKSNRSRSNSNELLFDAYDIGLRTHLSKVPSPSTQPDSTNNNKRDSTISMTSKFGIPKSHSSEDAADSFSTPYFDEEVDLNSVAATSAAAVKKAIEEAQARIRIAKEIMERKKESLQNHVKRRVNDGSKSEERKESTIAVKANKFRKDAWEICGKVNMAMPVSGLGTQNVVKASQVAPLFRERDNLFFEQGASGEMHEKKDKTAPDEWEDVNDRTQSVNECELKEKNFAMGNFEKPEETVEKLEVAAETHKQEEIERKVNVVEGACEMKETNARLLEEVEVMFKASHEAEASHKKLSRFQEPTANAENLDMPELEDNECLKMRIPKEEQEWLGNEQKPKEVFKQEENDTRSEDVPEREESEAAPKQIFHIEENGERKEACERVEFVNQQKEACTPEENEVGQNDVHGREESEKTSDKDEAQEKIQLRIYDLYLGIKCETKSDEDGGLGINEKLIVAKDNVKMLEEAYEMLEMNQEKESCDWPKSEQNNAESDHTTENEMTEATQEVLGHCEDNLQAANNVGEPEKVEISSETSGASGHEEDDVYLETPIHKENGEETEVTQASSEYKEMETEPNVVGVPNDLEKGEVSEVEIAGLDQVVLELHDIKKQIKDTTEAHAFEYNRLNLGTPYMDGQQKQNDPYCKEPETVWNSGELVGEWACEPEEIFEDAEEVEVSIELEEDENKFQSSNEGQWVDNGKNVEATKLPSFFLGDRETIETCHEIKASQNTEKNGENFSKNTGSEVTMEKEEQEKENVRNIDKTKGKEREREKERIAVERAIREARERAYTEARERAERAAAEKAAAEARRRAMAEARGRLEKASAEANDKTSKEARLKAERAAVERATAEARERALEKAISEKAALAARNQAVKSSGASRDKGMRQSFASSDSRYTGTGPTRSSGHPNSSNDSVPCSNDKFGVNGESILRDKASLERDKRTAERAAKALAEKNRRDLLAQKEQAERNRLAEALDADVKRWSSGKAGNLRALLSTLQYILGPDSGWQPSPLTDLVATAAVKKAYRKATLCVHPDKLQQRGASVQQKYTCEKVFDLLKDAWNKFSAEER